MVISLPPRSGRRRGSLLVDLTVAMFLLVGLLLPLIYSVASERRLARGAYQHTIAMEIVDGEIEILAAGEWRSFPIGVQDYPVKAAAATNLPPGRFVLDLRTNRLRLEWQPVAQAPHPAVVREVQLPMP